MQNINPNLIRTGSRVEDAMDIFKAAIDVNKLSKHTIQDWGKIYLPYLTDPEGWLGVWMLKSDELSSMLLKCRLWDVLYIKDSACVQTIRPVNREESDLTGPECESYDKYPLASDIGIPVALRFMIAKMAFNESLIIVNNEVNIKPVKGFYDLNKELNNGDVLPFQDPDRLGAHFLNKYICEINNLNTLAKTMQEEPEIKG
jgi:hypothetical protein